MKSHNEKGEILMNDNESMKPPNPSFSVRMSFYRQDDEIWYQGNVAAETTDQFDGWHAEVLGLLGDPPHAIDDSIELPEDLIEAIRARVGFKAPRAWAELQAAIAALKGDKGDRIQFEIIADRAKALRSQALWDFYWLHTGDSVPTESFSSLLSAAQKLRQFITTVLEESRHGAHDPDSDSLRAAAKQLHDVLPTTIKADTAEGIAALIESFDEQCTEFGLTVEGF